MWSEIEAEVSSLRERGVVPQLAVLRVGEDPATASYLRQISRGFAARGLLVARVTLPADSDQGTVAEGLAGLAVDPSIHGVLLELPLPAGLRSEPLLEAIPLEKDVEGLHPYHVGQLAVGRPTFVPSTPLAGLEILGRSAVELSGRVAVVVGRSPVVGRPMASLLVQADCTVIICHTRTVGLERFAREADVLVAAAGRVGLIRGEMLKPGAVVIDFGTNELEGRLVGDVDFASASAVASAITPVPGGTGPVTTAVLGRSLVKAAHAQV